MTECRICLEEEGDEFINPCKCNSRVHKQCIKNWILAENNSSPTDCEVCLHQYSIDFNEMFAEEFRRHSIDRDNQSQSSSEGEIEADNEEFEININSEQMEQSTAIQIAPQYSTPSIEYEGVQIARRVLRRFTRRDHLIKERCFAIFLLMIIADGMLAISYYEICHRDRQCKFDIIAMGTASTLFALCGMGYFSYLYCSFHNLCNNIGG